MLAILVVVAALIVVKLATDAGQPKSGKKASAAAASVTQQVASVPASVLNPISVGDARVAPAPITAPALISNGRPEVLYVGAEYCPYCAAERWAVAVALWRFGSLHGLGHTTSSPSDVYPSTATLSFHGATYTSSLLTLVAKSCRAIKCPCDPPAISAGGDPRANPETDSRRSIHARQRSAETETPHRRPPVARRLQRVHQVQ